MKYENFAALIAAISLFSAGTGVASGAQMHQMHQKREFRANEVIVKYRQGVTKTEMASVHSRHCADPVKHFEHLHMDHLKLMPGQTVEEAVSRLAADPSVEYAEPNYVVHTMTVPSDTQYGSLWGMNKIQAPAAWDNSTGSQSVAVAVIDTGIDYNHPDLKANVWVNQAELAGKAGVDDDGNGYVDDTYGYNAITGSGNPMDDNGHGTHVAGTIGAVGNNATGVTGINWNVKIIACKFMDSQGSGTTADAIDCLKYIRALKLKGINVIATNNSWGGGGYSQALTDAINQQQNILFMAAAGNETTDNDLTPSYPANNNLPNVISIAATTSTDGVASYSNYGRRMVDVAAPGSSILSTLKGGGYGYKSGTSMATPHVTGLAALLQANDPSLDWRGLKNLILSTGNPVTALASKTLTGRRINAFNAVTCIDSRQFAAITWPATPKVGTPATLEALSINCSASEGPVTVGLTGSEVVELKDDGIAPDKAAGDGIFAGTYTPVRTVETFNFSSPAGSETVGVIIAPLGISTASLAGGTVGVSYNQQIAATGGTVPYVWSATGLPAGFTIGSGTGVISGTAAASGTFPITVKLSDSRGVSTTRSFTLTVSPGSTKSDLIVTQIAGPASVTRGRSATFTVTVRNQGTVAAKAFYLSLYLSANTTISTSDYRVKDISVTGLAAGAEATYSVAVTIPTGIPVANYYSGAIADRTGLIAESAETNNTKYGNYLRVY